MRVDLFPAVNIVNLFFGLVSNIKKENVRVRAFLGLHYLPGKPFCVIAARRKAPQ